MRPLFLWKIRVKMKQIGCLLAAVVAAVVLAGCSVEQKEKEGREPLEFAIVEEDSLPEEFLGRIKKERGSVMCRTWQDESGLYIARGYGEQATSGYSIEVAECSVRDGMIYVHTSLIGPAKDEKISDTPTCPYIVLKVQEKDKDVVFE